MTFHDPRCSSLQVLLSNPPQFLPCDCPLSQLHHAEATTLLECRVVDGSVPNSDGSPAATASTDPVVPECPPPVNVVKLVPNRALAPTFSRMAEYLERIAARIRDGEWQNLTHVVLILDETDRVHTPWVCGAPINGGALVGLLEYVKHAVITRGSDHE